jgi:hypothetical protein
MTKNDISSDEYRPAEGTIPSLSQLTKEQFHDLMSSNHPDAKIYRDYSKREFKYRLKSNYSLNDFYRQRLPNV